MKQLLIAAALVAGFACTVTNAATISMKPAANGTAFSLYLNGGADVFDSIEVSIVPVTPTTFTGNGSGLNAGAPRPAGEALTYINRVLNGDPLDDPSFKGWSILGLQNTATNFFFGGGPIGQKILTGGEPSGELFIANVNLSTPLGRGIATVRTVDNGVFSEPLVRSFGIPEPATLAMAGMGIVGMVAVSRRRKA